jgi:hypothetical protein
MNTNYCFSTISEQSGGKATNSHRLIGCLTTLYLMSKFKPSMLVRHAATLQPYLSTKCNVSMVHVATLLILGFFDGLTDLSFSWLFSKNIDYDL